MATIPLRLVPWKAERKLANLLNLRSDLPADILQRDHVNACQLYLIQGH